MYFSTSLQFALVALFSSSLATPKEIQTKAGCSFGGQPYHCGAIPGANVGGSQNPISCNYCPSNVGDWADGTGNFYTSNGYGTQCLYNSGCSCCAPAGSAETPADPGYINGWCVAHIVQHQRAKVVATDAPGQNSTNWYGYEITLYDNNTPRNVIGYSGTDLTYVAPGQYQGLDSLLPEVFEVGSMYQDSDPFLMSYGGQSWNAYSVDNQCSLQAAHNSPNWDYQGGQRMGDCGFQC